MPVGGITELVGPAGVGKSQLCHMLTVSAFVMQQQQQSATQACNQCSDCDESNAASLYAFLALAISAYNTCRVQVLLWCIS